MRCHAPEMSKRILNEAGAVSVELGLDRLEDLRALGNRLFDHAVYVRKIHIEAYGTGADGGSAGVSLPHFWIFIGQHDVRVPNLQFGMADLAVRAIHANLLGGPEHFLVVLDGLSRASDDQIGCDGVVIFGNIRDFIHDFSPQIVSWRLRVTARNADRRRDLLRISFYENTIGN